MFRSLVGAVLFGLDPTIINVRRSRLTYGVSVLNRFEADFHLLEKRVVKDNIEWCADIFDKFVLVDQSIGLGDTVVRKYTPARLNQPQCIISFYCSESDKPLYVTDPGVRKIGTIETSRALRTAGMISTSIRLTPRSRMPSVCVVLVGTLVLDMFHDGYSKMDHSSPTKDRRREIQTRMVFGDTEIKVSALDVSTGKCVRATIDFLNK